MRVASVCAPLSLQIALIIKASLAHTQVWSLIGEAAPGNPFTSGTTLRVAIINKSRRGCNVELALPKSAVGSYAQLHWLKNDEGISSSYGVSWRGQSYEGTSDGKLRGAIDIQNLKPTGERGGSWLFKLPLPPGQAALLLSGGR